MPLVGFVDPVLDLFVIFSLGCEGGLGGIFNSASSKRCERRSDTSGNSTANWPSVYSTFWKMEWKLIKNEIKKKKMIKSKIKRNKYVIKLDKWNQELWWSKVWYLEVQNNLSDNACKYV